MSTNDRLRTIMRRVLLGVAAFAAATGLAGCGSDDDPVADAKASQALDALASMTSTVPADRVDTIKASCKDLIEKRAENSGGELAGRSHRTTTHYEVSDIQFTGKPEPYKPAGKITRLYYDIPVTYVVTPDGEEPQNFSETCRFNDETSTAEDIR